MAEKHVRRTYYLEDGTPVGIGTLRKLSKQKQMEVMRAWFFKHYSDPLILPYDSSEGGYQWIWGGPFGAKDELRDEFSGATKDSALDELADELTEQNFEWSANPDSLPQDEAEVVDLSSLPLTPHDILELSLDEIEAATRLKQLGESEQFMRRLLFANAITALETYLADRFRQEIKGDAELVQKFVETDPKLKDHKILLSAAAATARNLETLVFDQLGEVIWHRLATVSAMYKDTLDITFPKNLGALYKAVLQRHDIVHRNGKSKAGEMGLWDNTAILALVAKVRELAAQLEQALKIRILSNDVLVEP
ncbi:hypothetical protein RBB79_17875 [Tunturiibacter empetritectus]|uniref:RiboL-PSP-HEPN domain-containing protein n=1 Tax=Tunturiibacter lichenicola TaxID=2051959 RepID=A0A852VM86_9BACT|nr:hypothetical protein [Edaphobacter lichenicola]NYF91514.1 hypothetical protein [Edaphobacter lichenicola]